MKLTKSQLKQIIKEELTSQVNKINENAPVAGVEGRIQRLPPQATKLLGQIGGLLATKSPQIKVDFLLDTLLPLVGIGAEDVKALISRLGTDARKDADAVEPEADGEESP